MSSDRRTRKPIPPIAARQSIAAPTVYQLKVNLQGIRPPIWRRVLVDGSIRLDELHEVIQAAFGWWNYHLYDFEFDRTRYVIPDLEWDFGPPSHDPRRFRLDQLATTGTSFTYTYDFGDFWVHKGVVEKLVDAPADVTLPACTGGRRAGPPEDCGGPWGYAELLGILADPTHPDHALRSEWAEEWEGRNDPDAFDPSEFSDNLRSVRLGRFDD